MSCRFCNQEKESVHHLFFACVFSWKTWAYRCVVWEVQWVYHCDPMRFFCQWINLLHGKSIDKVWSMLFGAIAWSIWLCRNEKVFNNKVLEFSQVIDLIKLKLSHWIKAKWPHISFLDMWCCPTGVSLGKKKKMVRVDISWAYPHIDSVKFNVDGSATGKPGPVDIGGVLRNHLGDDVVCFSNFIGVEELNMAEMLAIREAMLVFWILLGSEGKNLSLKAIRKSLLDGLITQLNPLGE
ncbi:hypothetical protein PTKIN_Ptkin14bG0191400 [Pterospermum kingtungense]